jgi:MFS family permease
LSTSQPPATRNRWLLISAVGATVFMAQFDATVVTVALPTITHQFGTSASLTQWVVLGFVLPMIGLSLPSGRWLDRVGQREAFVFAVAGFALASVAVGVSPTIGSLIGARILQGAFGALLFSLSTVVATVAVQPAARGRAMGLVMTVGSLGGICGPVLGGLILEHLAWPWVFYVNLPVGAAVGAVAFHQLGAGPPLRLPGRVWLVDASLLSIAGAAVMLALTMAAENHLAWLLVSLAAVPLVAAWLRRPDGRAVTDLLRIREVLASHIGLLCQTAAVFAVMFVLPFHLQDQGVEPARMGLMLLAFPCAAMATGLLAGLLADAWSPVAVCLVGGTVLTVGILLLTPMNHALVGVNLAWRLTLVGIGTGMFAGPVVPIAMSRAPADLLGTTGASTSAARQIGLGLGPALATMAWAAGGYTRTGLSAATVVAALLVTVGTLGLLTVRRPTTAGV